MLPTDDPDAAADALITASYDGEFCVSASFDPRFVAGLMRAGFLVMAIRVEVPVLLPKLHTFRAILDPASVHGSRSCTRLLDRYTLRPGADFDTVLRSCVATHGEDWLTPELVRCFQALPRLEPSAITQYRPSADARMLSFALYQEDRLVAGEFGVACGGAYTSYSGYRTENSSGSVQLLSTGRFLAEAGFVLWDLGMPMDYKKRLGASTVPMREFAEAFRAARCPAAVRRRI